jgi:hypothetical protein
MGMGRKLKRSGEPRLTSSEANGRAWRDKSEMSGRQLIELEPPDTWQASRGQSPKAWEDATFQRVFASCDRVPTGGWRAATMYDERIPFDSELSLG